MTTAPVRLANCWRGPLIRLYRFEPGDVITTGSPSGVGYRRNPKVFMKAGDTVEVKVDSIGALTNPIAAG